MSAPGDISRRVIEMDGVTVGSMRDPHLVMVEEVNWSVNRGDFWVVGGLQGSGKTDFLFLTAGLMAPLAGSYRLAGAEMPIFEEERLRQRLKLGLVFDGGQLLNHLTVSENIALPLRYHRNLRSEEARDEVQRMLDWTDLGPWADSTPGTLGRNWQQRVGLARALMLQPEILLLDNPLGGLDLRHRNWWIGMLGKLARGHEFRGNQPMTIVVTADDLRPWRKLADHIAVLRNKRLALLGTWEDAEKVSQQQLAELLAESSPAY